MFATAAFTISTSLKPLVVSRRWLCCNSVASETIFGNETPSAASISADCVVVGGGISGLCTALALSTCHSGAAREVLLTESRDKVGGNIISIEKDGFLWEEGPNSFQPSDPLLTLAVDCGLKDDLVFADPNAPRFVLWNGRLKPVPSKPTDLPFFDLMSISGKLRAGFGTIGIRPPPPGHEESVEEFVRRNLGDEVFERLIEPFCSGVYAGDPSKLSMKAAFGKFWELEKNGGSIISGLLKAIQDRKKNPKLPRDPRLPSPKGQTVASFRKGLTMLPEAISSRLGSKVKLSWKLTSIKKLEGHGYVLTYETPRGKISVRTRSVVLTIPSYAASNLLCPLSAAAADSLSKFYYPPVAAVAISYSKKAIRGECLIDGELKGFGQLHPRSQGVETLGTIYSSSLFPDRAPPGRVLLLNFIGGATNPGILSKGVGNNDQKVLVLAATNTPYALDQAIRRRFDKRIYIPLPDAKARQHMFKVHLGDTPHNLTESDFEILGRKTEGFSGSDISVCVKDVLFEPVRKTQDAMFFVKISDGMLMPCGPKQPGAIQTTMEELASKGLASKILPPPIARTDFDKVLARQRPTVSKKDLEVHEKFTKEFGEEG